MEDNFDGMGKKFSLWMSLNQRSVGEVQVLRKQWQQKQRLSQHPVHLHSWAGGTVGAGCGWLCQTHVVGRLRGRLRLGDGSLWKSRVGWGAAFWPHMQSGGRRCRRVRRCFLQKVKRKCLSFVGSASRRGPPSVVECRRTCSRNPSSTSTSCVIWASCSTSLSLFPVCKMRMIIPESCLRLCQGNGWKTSSLGPVNIVGVQEMLVLFSSLLKSGTLRGLASMGFCGPLLGPSSVKCWIIIYYHRSVWKMTQCFLNALDSKNF